MAKASPLQLIKKGLGTGDWKLVAQGYEGLTGEKVRVPAAPKSQVDLTDDFELVTGVVRKVADQVLVQLGVSLQEMLADHVLAATIDALRGDQEPAKAKPAKKTKRKPQPDPEPRPEPETQPAPAVTEPEVDKTTLSVQERARMASGRDISKFDFGPQELKREDGQVATKALPFQAPGTNSFVDDGKQFRNLVQADKKLWGDAEPTERPEPFQQVLVTCDRCKKKEEVHPDLSPKNIEGEWTTYLCNSCIGKGGSR